MDDEQTSLWTAEFGWIIVAHLLNGLGYASMVLLPLYLHELGASRTDIGVIMATASVAGLLFRPVVGFGLDRFGRKPIMYLATSLIGLAFFLFLAIDEIGPLLYFDRAIFGIAEGALFSANFAFAADIIPAPKRTQGIAIFGVAGLTALLVNPLSDALQIAPKDLRYFFPVVGIVVCSSMIPLLFIQERVSTAPTHRPNWRELPTALTHHRLWSVWLASIIFASLVSTFFAFAAVTAASRNLATPSSLWLTYVFGAVVVRLGGGHLPDRYGTHNFMAPSLAFYVAGALVLASVQSAEGFALAGLLSGIAHGACFPILTSQVISRSPEAFRGSALAFYTGLWGLSALVSKPLMGQIADRHGDDTMFLTLSALSIIGLALWALIEHFQGGPKEPSANSTPA